MKILMQGSTVFEMKSKIHWPYTAFFTVEMEQKPRRPKKSKDQHSKNFSLYFARMHIWCVCAHTYECVKSVLVTLLTT